MADVKFNRHYTKTQLDAMTTAVDGKIYFGTDGGIYVGKNDGTVAKKADINVAIPFGEVDSTSTSTAYTATVPGISQLVDGVCVLLKNGVVTSEAGFTININGLGAYPSFNNMTAATQDSTIFNVNYTMLFVYDSTRVVGSTTGAWCCYRGYNSDNNTIGYQLRTNSQTMKNGASAKFYRYRLLFTSADGKSYIPANTSTSTNATASRTVIQTPIDPFGAIYYYGSTSAIAAGSSPGTGVLWEQYNFTLGYSFNRTGAALTLTSSNPVYIKCAPQSDGSAIIDSDNPYVQALPSTDDGKIYIFLGIATGETTVELLPVHPVYYYKSGAIRLWTASQDLLDAKQETLVSGTNIKTINNESLLGSGNITIQGGGADNVYWATYGTTTYSQVSSAYSDGKVVAVMVEWTSGYEVLYLTSYNGDAGLFYFSSPVEANKVAHCSVNESDVWSSVTAFEPEDHSKLRTSWQTTPDNTHYPSEKLVKDSLDLKGDITSEQIGTVSDPSNSWYTKTETDTLLGAKQATLVSGTNIKTVNNESLLGSGNITIQGGGGGAVKYDEAQTLTDAQKAQARTNIFSAGMRSGVISQTQTWTGSAATGYDYTLSDIVTGEISEELIAQAALVGATFNSTSGYFEMNGLTDLTANDVRYIIMTFDLVKVWAYVGGGYFRENNTFRTLPTLKNVSISPSFGVAFYSNWKLETLHIDSSGQFAATSIANMFAYCSRLKSITGGPLVASAATATSHYTSTFLQCYSLESLKFKGMKYGMSFGNSSRLDLASVVYIVNNATNTSAITLTLHATAYARCSADTTEYTYSGNTYTGILALATAKNITIASA